MRKNGYYWVKYEDVWQTAWFGGEDWSLIWSYLVIFDDELEAINETRLEPPTP